MRVYQKTCTLISAPNASVSGIQTTALSKDSATLQWTSVPCANRGGTLLHYTVNLNTSGSLLHNTTTTTSFTFSGLTPFTRYQASVRYVNRVGAGPESDVFTFTTSEGGQGSLVACMWREDVYSNVCHPCILQSAQRYQDRVVVNN